MRKFEELVENVIGEKQSYAAYRRSNMEPKGSNWEQFALMFDIGVLDLENFAADMGFDDFDDLDISIGPASLLQRDKKKFIKALKDSSISASQMKDGEIVSTIKSYYS